MNALAHLLVLPRRLQTDPGRLGQGEGPVRQGVRQEGDGLGGATRGPEANRPSARGTPFGARGPRAPDAAAPGAPRGRVPSSPAVNPVEPQPW